MIHHDPISPKRPTASPKRPTAPVSVITTCYGRNTHLYNLLAALANSSTLPAEVIIVNDDADPERLLSEYALNIVQIPTTNDGNDKQARFDIGHNRNIGATHASHDALIFLDVDCLVAVDSIAGLYSKLMAHPEALLMGQPKYLTRPLSAAESTELAADMLNDAALDTLSVYNPYRPNFAPTDSLAPAAIAQTEDFGTFWSLCFTITRQQFEALGGFDTAYVGYGAEDTDFAFRARACGMPFYLTAEIVYHQQHGVYRPPLNHLDSIVINANRFYDQWQHWAMAGWLGEFAALGLIDWQAAQTAPITLLRAPTEQELEESHCPDAPFV
ncbi:MAG: glycosyltransferase [Psychrobacter sp.]|uniref:glycosyltransferase family 2 protein n=1 Tax=Psychrobacter sp. TaxID=56811 RepID=UPI0026488F72|nr:glycosyltransferase [Psychrobacter sp.]MDN5619937.1 glycosyltransferase [Psychrobacter sp.]